MWRSLTILLLCFVPVLLAIALRGVPAAEPVRAASVPADGRAVPAGGPTVVKPAAAGTAKPAGRGPRGPRTVASGKGPVLPHCDVKLIQEVEVPGIEAGVLMSLEAKEGMDVRAGITLGQIDDREPMMQKKISEIKHEAAKALAENDIDKRFAEKSAEVPGTSL